MLQTEMRQTAQPMSAILAFQHPRMIQRHMDDYGVSAERAEKRFVALKEFLAVCAAMPGAKVTSKEVDAMWHTFLLFTKDYRNFCNDYLGRMLDHQPFETPNPAAYLATRRFAERLFGKLDLEMWPIETKGDTSGCDD